MSVPKHLPALVLLILSAVSAHAEPQFTGLVKYEFVNENKEVAITTALIENASRENATGTLQVQLWATERPYQGGPIRGDQLASYKLEGLSPGKYYKDLRTVAPYTPPPKWGTYAICVVLLEFKNGAYVISNYANLPGLAKLGPLKAVTMGEPFRWETSYEGGTIDIGVGKIAHRRQIVTGSLKIAVWACEEPYKGGAIEGHELGSVQKEGLKPGFEYNDVKNVAKFVPPPGGTYHIVFTLSEFGANREYGIVDYYNQPETVVFPVVKKPAESQ